MRSRVLATALATVASFAAAVILGILVAVGVTWAFFNNTRGDGYAAFLIAFIGTALFVNVVVFAWMASRKQAENPYLVAGQAIIWILMAAYLTSGTCADYFITWSNVRWILTSNDWQAEVRAHALHWIIRGWLTIATSGLLSALVSNRLMSRSRIEPLLPVTN